MARPKTEIAPPPGPPTTSHATPAPPGLVRQHKLGDQLYEEILRQITAGRLPEGERLPSESDLATAFSVSRPVVREALSRLRADGVVVSRHGSGSYVEKRPSQEFLRLAPIGGIADLMRCFELRIALEGDAAALAASRRSSEDLGLLEAALQELDRAIAAGEIGAEADIQFHAIVARTSKNKLFEKTLEALAQHIFAGMSVARKLSVRMSRERLAVVQKEHRLIGDAIRREDPEAARAAMRSHIGNARARVLSDSTEP